MCHTSGKQRGKVTFFWSAISTLPNAAQEAAFQLISPQPVLQHLAFCFADLYGAPVFLVIHILSL